MRQSAKPGQCGPARGAEAVTLALQHYADRGVFKGFSSRQGPGGRLDFRFTWLTPRPTMLSYDPPARLITFRNLLPGLRSKSALLVDVKALIDERAGRAILGHKRIDPRRVELGCSVRRGQVSVTLTVRGKHHDYAVRKGLNLVNDIFVLLHSTYPDYLSEHFGLPAD